MLLREILLDGFTEANEDILGGGGADLVLRTGQDAKDQHTEEAP
ncbi:MAG: hypothetical protein QOF88_2355 [Mycobacterium sp.]|nr:hypothetical protein [Mycobacterium sp.]